MTTCTTAKAPKISDEQKIKLIQDVYGALRTDVLTGLYEYEIEFIGGGLLELIRAIATDTQYEVKSDDKLLKFLHDWVPNLYVWHFVEIRYGGRL